LSSNLSGRLGDGFILAQQFLSLLIRLQRQLVMPQAQMCIAEAL
jgi:hypothetical protein